MTGQVTRIAIIADDRASATLGVVAARMSAINDRVDRFRNVSAFMPRTMEGLATAQYQFNRALVPAKKHWGEFTEGAEKAARRIAVVGAALIGAGGALVRWANSAASAADDVADLHEQTGVATRDIQVFGKLASLSGGSQETAAKSLAKLSENMAKARAGSQELRAAFAAAGITDADLKKITRPSDMLVGLSEAFSKSKNEGAKLALAHMLMGKSSNSLIQALSGGPKALQAFGDAMERNGEIFSQSQLDAAASFENTWSRLTGKFTGLKNTLGLKLATALEPIIDKLLRFIEVNKDAISSGFDTFLKHLGPIMEAVGKAALGMFWILDKLVAVFGAIAHVLGPDVLAWLGLAWAFSGVISAAFSLFFVLIDLSVLIGGALWTGVVALGSALFVCAEAAWALVVPMAVAFAPILLIVAAIAAVIAAIAVLWVNWDAITTNMAAAWERVKAAFSTGWLAGFVQVFIEAFQAIANAILGTIKTILPDSWLPESFKKFQSNIGEMHVKYATGSDPGQQAAGGTREPSSSAAKIIAQGAQADIRNRVDIRIDAEGRPKILDMIAGSKNTELNVNTGLLALGM